MINKNIELLMIPQDADEIETPLHGTPEESVATEVDSCLEDIQNLVGTLWNQIKGMVSSKS